jgi:adenosylcobinamide-GDP ribazoletransferase
VHTSAKDAFTACCLRGIPAARPDGLGALVANTQPGLVPAAWLVVAVAAATFAVPGAPWAATTGVVLAALVVAVLVRHVRRRLGGVTGDVLGAACELATLAVLIPGTL